MCANCKDCKDCCKKGSCVASMVAKTLVIVGGLNWGLVGVSMLLNNGSNWNLVNLLLGSFPVVEAIVYVLVGLAAVMSRNALVEELVLEESVINAEQLAKF